MDLARNILLLLENCDYTGGMHDLAIEGHSPSEISYHVRLLFDAGLIDASQINSTTWKPRDITWNGHEFLDASRDTTRWEKAKQMVREKGGPITLSALNLALSELVKKLFS